MKEMLTYTALGLKDNARKQLKKPTPEFRYATIANDKMTGR